MQSVTVQLPDQIYQRMRRLAHARNHSVEDVVARVLENALEEEVKSSEIDLLTQLAYLDDDDLWQAARTRVADDKAQRMQELVWKLQAEGLTPTDEEDADVLQRHAQQVMLIRAEAAALLAERGFEVHSLSRISM
ncbi:conserved protein of unknown function [Candidatus Promineifilum breve]|uniref:Uncharacterized protein n=1 Tax=Candidatus Promineifilum breve TaxID=1806508 RepID=A0A170PJN0_9CHLR|nr:hypothetical protein [Candidatus Promineifilum breve]CUS05757.1 conserved protein of unknown function [Candidatus Promineifilum breve]